jgi:hypothetical protein
MRRERKRGWAFAVINSRISACASPLSTAVWRRTVLFSAGSTTRCWEGKSGGALSVSALAFVRQGRSYLVLLSSPDRSPVGPFERMGRAQDGREGKNRRGRGTTTRSHQLRTSSHFITASIDACTASRALVQGFVVLVSAPDSSSVGEEGRVDNSTDSDGCELWRHLRPFLTIQWPMPTLLVVRKQDRGSEMRERREVEAFTRSRRSLVKEQLS